MKFFQLIPHGTSFDFVGQRKRYLMVSVFLVLAALATLVFNSVNSGSPLNFGIDFQGGSQVRLAFTKPVETKAIRQALVDEGHDGASVVEVPDAENQALVRTKEVLSIDEKTEAKCKDALGELKEGKLLEKGFAHPQGSSKFFLRFESQPKYSEIESILTKAGCDGKASAGVGEASEFPVEYALIGIGAKIRQDLEKQLGEGIVKEIVASETVGAKVGAQLKIDGVVSLLYAIGFIFLFVMIRFDLRFAPGGIVALTHDAILVIGCFAITGKEFNLQTIAALLTIIGYSINDTIVVFDRVREKVALHRDAPIEETTNQALNETLSRTVLTSGTTMVVVMAVWILGSGPIKDFAFALFIGVIVGTYSSLFVAAPIFLWVNERFYKGKGHLLDLQNAEREGTGVLLGAAGGGAPPEDGPEGGGSGGSDPSSPAAGKKAARRRRRRS